MSDIIYKDAPQLSLHGMLDARELFGGEKIYTEVKLIDPISNRLDALFSAGREPGTMPSVRVIHDTDLDGTVSAFGVLAFFQRRYPELEIAIDLVPVIHGKPFSDKIKNTYENESLENVVVIVVDHMLSSEHFLGLNGKTALTLWIDHHDIEVDEVLFPTQGVTHKNFVSLISKEPVVSSAMITATLFRKLLGGNPEEYRTPDIYLLTSVYDTWKFREFCESTGFLSALPAVMGLGAWFSQPESYDTLMECCGEDLLPYDFSRDSIYAILGESASLYEKISVNFDYIAKNKTAYLQRDVDGAMRNIAVVYHSANVSLLLDHILRVNLTLDYAIAVFATKDGSVRVSVRSVIPRNDCRAIVKPLGGNGHATAAGTVITTIQLADFLLSCSKP